MGFPVEERMIAAAEAKLGAALPKSYRHRMQRNNGGELRTAQDSWQLHPIFDDSDRTRLKRTCNDIVRETEAARGWPNFPVNAVAIGANGWGDLLVFMRDPADPVRFASTLWWWDHETGDLIAVADDLARLLQDADS